MKLPVVNADGDDDRHTRCLQLPEELPLVLEHAVKPLEVFADGVFLCESRAENQVIAIWLKETNA